MAKDNLIWAYLIHLSYNMWGDWKNPEVKSPYYACQPFLRCDENLWDELISRMADAGVNVVVIDVGDGVQFKSQPEIAVKNAWPIDKLREKLDRIRKLGMTPIPKLNFSTCHDQWLGQYARMVSTPPYYQVVSHLIAETIEIFDTPSLFHLGMDEGHGQHRTAAVFHCLDFVHSSYQLRALGKRGAVGELGVLREPGGNFLADDGVLAVHLAGQLRMHRSQIAVGHRVRLGARLERRVVQIRLAQCRRVRRG